MNKIDQDKLKVKELLYLDAFKRTYNQQDYTWSPIGENIMSNAQDPKFHKLSEILGDKNPFDLCFVGGNNQSIFLLKLIRFESSSHYRICCPSGYNRKKVKQDLLILNEFIQNQVKKVSRWNNE